MRNSMVVWVLLSAVLSGCASTKSVKEPENRQGDSHDNRPAAEHLIATDLVNALIQVPALHPQATRLRMLKPEHPFGETLRSVLTASGYPVQLVDSGHGAGFVDYLVTNRQQSRPGVSSTYQVMVGSVGIKRDYRSVNGTIEPASTMFATGVDASMIRTNDGIFSPEPLVSEYGIDPLRLFPSGKGESQLFDANDPHAGVNRRVEFLRYARQ